MGRHISDTFALLAHVKVPHRACKWLTCNLLEEMVNEIQEKLNIDIRKDVVYGACTQFYLNSNSSLNGETITTWEIGYEVEIDGRMVELQATVYEDSKGMGVLSFELKVGAGF